jgi:PAS domain S-box-containing protein
VIKKYSQYLIVVPMSIGILTLIGWTFSIEAFKRPFHGSVAMNPMNAVCFIFASTAFLLDYRFKASRGLSVLSAFIALLVALAGILKLLGGFCLPIDIDSWLFHQSILSERAVGALNRISPNSAVSFILTGLSLRLAIKTTPTIKVVCSCMMLTVFITGLFAFIGHMYHVRDYHGVLHYIPMAMHTAVSFIFLSLAFLFENKDEMVMQVVDSPYSGGSMARALIPVVIGVPLVFGYLGLRLLYGTTVSEELAFAMLVSSIEVFFLWVIWFAARKLNDADARHQKSDLLYRKMVENIKGYSIVMLDAEGRVRTWSKGAESILGYSAEEVIGQNFSIFYTPGDIEQNLPQSLLRKASYDKPAHYEGRRVKKDGSVFWADVSITALYDQKKGIIGFTEVTRDLAHSHSVE